MLSGGNTMMTLLSDDKYHLNDKGTSILANNLKHAIHSTLNITIQRNRSRSRSRNTNSRQEKADKKARYYMYEIVANKRNEIDVDKMDYFARDCHGLGMKSNFDHLRYISQCRVMFSSDKPDETTIAVRDKPSLFLPQTFEEEILRVYSKNDEKFEVLKEETAKCLITVELKSAIDSEHQGNAASKRKLNADGKSVPSNETKSHVKIGLQVDDNLN
ncbi:SAMHD1 [Mytilus edulis]|uniref:SAMHD1 n=1 Tax=Mytilus edulis TaxID=6550 RepID=A0A8S3QEK9_MYTED|nr:SAMHD1 [Mytilus edulis]